MRVRLSPLFAAIAVASVAPACNAILGNEEITWVDGPQAEDPDDDDPSAPDTGRGESGGDASSGGLPSDATSGGDTRPRPPDTGAGDVKVGG